MILGSDGENVQAPRRRQRHAVPGEGLPAGSHLNYLARLGWSHGDDEVFSMEQVRVVRPRPPVQVGRPVQPRKAQLAE
jgi:hypothetical protein